MSKYITIDRILSKFHRDLKGTNIGETDLVEWIGEASDFLKMPEIQEEAVAFLEVQDYHAALPCGFHAILQVARNNEWTKSRKIPVCPKEVLKKEKNRIYCYEHAANTSGYPVPLDEDGIPLTDFDVAYYRPFFDMQWAFNIWANTSTYKEKFTPVRLADHTFFNSVVCKEKSDKLVSTKCQDEYTLVGDVNEILRFSFPEGAVAVAYLKSKTDRETGYPLIPDEISYITAISYYVKWKIAERFSWNGREGFINIAHDTERLWGKYAKQAKNHIKMPKNIDDFQDLLEQSHYLIPRHDRYYGFFGNLNQRENRVFNNPDNR